MNQTMICALALTATLSPLCTSPAAAAPATTSPTATTAADWGTDLNAALSQAQSSGKAVLIVFTGSDWCPPCKMLKQNVFDKPDFAGYAQKNFELVDIDIPNGNHVSEEQKAANRALAQKMNVKGFPTTLLLNQNGAILGGFVGYRDWAETQALWNTALANKAKADAAFAAAAQLSGVEKAKALNAINELCPADLRDNNVALTAQIIAADTSDSLGLQAAAAKAAAQKAAAQEVEQILKTTPADQMLATIDKQLARTDIGEELKMTLNWARFDTLLMSSQSIEDLEKVKADIITFGQENPSQQAQVDRIIKGLFAMPMADLLQRIKSIRQQQG